MVKTNRRAKKEKEKEITSEVKRGNGNTSCERKNCLKNLKDNCEKIKHFIQIGQNGQSVVINVRRQGLKSVILKHSVG